MGKIEIINYRSIDLVHCLNCRSYFVEPLPKEEDMNRMYPDEYYYSENASIGFNHFVEGAISHLREGRYFGKKLMKVRDHGNILDYGCGTGFFLLGIRSASSWGVYGIETAPMTIKFANEVLNIPVKKARLSHIDYEDDFFDYIHCNQVLEHLSDPVPVIKEFNRVLKKGGTLSLSLPNGLCDVRPVLRENRSGNVPRSGQPHLFYFHPVVLSKIIEKNDFTIQKIYTRSVRAGLQDLGIIPRKLFRKIFKKRSKTTAGAVNDLNEQDKKLKETELNYKDYKRRIHEIIKTRNIKTSMLYAGFKNLKKNLIRLPISFPIGHCLEIVATKK